jgi:hypothetical protein
MTERPLSRSHEPVTVTTASGVQHVVCRHCGLEEAYESCKGATAPLPVHNDDLPEKTRRDWAGELETMGKNADLGELLERLSQYDGFHLSHGSLFWGSSFTDEASGLEFKMSSDTVKEALSCIVDNIGGARLPEVHASRNVRVFTRRHCSLAECAVAYRNLHGVLPEWVKYTNAKGEQVKFFVSGAETAGDEEEVSALTREILELRSERDTLAEQFEAFVSAVRTN